jgi:hypothetical protein
MSESPFALTPEEGEALGGKTLLVGKTYVDESGTTLSQEQFLGEIVRADPHGVTVMRADTGRPEYMPPDRRMFRPAPPGDYRLGNTGEVVTDPDVMCTATITRPAAAPD